MPVPAPPRQHRPTKAPRISPAVPLAALAVSAAAAGTAVAAAPDGAAAWTSATALAAWCCLAAAVAAGTLLVRRARRETRARGDEADRLRARLAQLTAESAHLADVTMPALAERLRDGADADDALTGVAPPADPQLRRVAHAFAVTVEEAVRHAAALDAGRREARRELDEITAGLERLTRVTLPAAVAELREGRSVDKVLHGLDRPRVPLLRATAESFVRELALSERRAAAAQAVSAKALSRVQAKTVAMLADLREMQERHGEEVFGDLLGLDHTTSQLGLMTDRLALLMGGRSSRAWNRPIVMESILRGAAGRIAAYRRVRLHSSSTAAVSGFAAEGVMHLLAELMDNAANFSPPIDEVHVYVEERSAGVVVTVEDSGLRMADAAMRRAEEAVSGRLPDLASLQSTRLGLAVVGRLAVKYGITVNFRPSSRGGTGVVVLLPPQLLAQQRHPEPARAAAHPTAALPAPRPAPVAQAPRPALPRTAAERPAPLAGSSVPAAGLFAPPVESPEQGRHRRSPADATRNGLPVRTPGRTMAEAEREQRRPATGAPSERPAHDAGSRFAAFHRGRRSAGTAGDADPGPPAATS